MPKVSAFVFSDFNLAGTASYCATIFTNPMEVIKTRIQLQGELAARGSYVVPYKSVLSAFITVAKHDGILALQKGLVPALCFQYILNAFRLTIYDFGRAAGLTKNWEGNESLLKGMFWGALGGIVGSAFASPFFLIKTHLQSQAVKSIAVGYQHTHTGMLHAISEIYGAHGIKGLYRGVLGTFPRAALGSGAQLATFGYTKDFMVRHNLSTSSAALNSFIAGVFAGSIMSVAITPPDVILTRLYNQGTDPSGKGLLYNGVIDCLLKILKTEGPLGLYKGFWPTYLRIGPHSALVLLFYDQFKLLRIKYIVADESLRIPQLNKPNTDGKNVIEPNAGNLNTSKVEKPKPDTLE